jgi:hypothetical protein
MRFKIGTAVGLIYVVASRNPPTCGSQTKCEDNVDGCGSIDTGA